MSTDLDFVRYVCDQIRGAGVITHRKMFGEYALYCDGKVVALLCDNQCFLKPTETARALLPRAKEGLPYPGAKPHLLLDEVLEDGDALSRLIALTAAQMVPPKVPSSKIGAKKAAQTMAKTTAKTTTKKATKKSSPRRRTSR